MGGGRALRAPEVALGGASWPEDGPLKAPRSELALRVSRQVAAPSVPAALLSPVRLPLGPEPAVPPFVELPPGLLPPPGFTLARAATLPASAKAEGATTPHAPALRSQPADLRSAAAAGAEPAAGPAKVAIGAGPMPPLPPPPALSAAPPQELAPGISVRAAEVAGSPCTRVEWSIEDLRGKLQASMGRPLVSPPFGVRGLRNLRLMVFPDARDAVKSARSRERKSMYSAMIRRGPLHGALKLKADCPEAAVALRLYLTVGAARSGPFAYDFSQCAIHGCDDFGGADWLRQLDAASGCLRVGVEILEASRDGGAPAAGSHAPVAAAAVEEEGGESGRTPQRAGPGSREPSGAAGVPVSPGLLGGMAGTPGGPQRGRARCERTATAQPRAPGR
uniref:Uncharacterized protein n=1 Tax=Alexandrium monilatum TaxID=311494 RepID=A0A7S4S294_9DINO